MKNGRLQRLAAAEFDVFVTLDRSIVHQSVLPAPLAMITLHVRANRVQTVLPLAPAIRDALAAIRPGDSVRIQG